MSDRMVKCVKLGRELPGLERPPFNDDLGRRIFENVSKEAWIAFREHLKMLINEYRLVLGTEESNKFIEKRTEEYFFGQGAEAPPGYVPPKNK